MKKILLFLIFIFVNLLFFVFVSKNSYAQDPSKTYILRVTNYLEATSITVRFFEKRGEAWVAVVPDQTKTIGQGQEGVNSIILSPYSSEDVAVEYWSTGDHGRKSGLLTFADPTNDPNTTNGAYCAGSTCTRNWTLLAEGESQPNICGIGIDNNGDGEFDEHCKATVLTTPTAERSCSVNIVNGEVKEIVIFKWNAALAEPFKPVYPTYYQVYRTNFEGRGEEPIGAWRVSDVNQSQYS